ncbi:hypothetical protein ONE63_001006 [Megalurothrips usitatus]|uniref:MULE transposase domain-containing protein n=1 Tax=Megalurothrips usitatus TaxID=439358 RepID=A0AAV7XEY6_9NEOP|nr:hypothetical protein ONE63_001006 [Megalurothrips usitatus]
MVGEPGEESLIFASDRMLSVPKRQKDVIGSDSTFKITPRLLGALQVLILSFYALGKCFSMAYVVMKAKTTNSYATALGALREMGMPANIVVLDWEVAERNAWRRVYPGVKLWGCLWHFIRVSNTWCIIVANSCAFKDCFFFIMVLWFLWYTLHKVVNL